MVGLLGMKNKVDVLQQWKNLFKSKCNKNSEHSQYHWDQLMQLNFIMHKNKNSQYEVLEDFLSHKFVVLTPPKVSIDQVNQYSLPLDNAIRLVFVDGHFNLNLSTKNTGFFIVQSGYENENIKLPIPIKSEFFLHLTESLAEKITFIHLPTRKIELRPIYLLHITSGKQDVLNTVSYRHHFMIEDNSQSAIIEHYVSLNQKWHFTGTRLTFSIGNYSRLHHIKVVSEKNNSYHFAHNDFNIGCSSKVDSTSFILSSRFSRQNTSVKLNGNDTFFSLNSLVLPINTEVVDTRTYIEHNQYNCTSRQIHKTITNHQGISTFNGHIKVQKYAIKTDSKMVNKNLLIGDKAKADSKPQLEIYTDDVKCTHGATVGQINTEQIFYLRSRGISKNKANQMILYAFAMELVELIEDKKMKDVVLQKIYVRLIGMIS